MDLQNIDRALRARQESTGMGFLRWKTAHCQHSHPAGRRGWLPLATASHLPKISGFIVAISLTERDKINKACEPVLRIHYRCFRTPLHEGALPTYVHIRVSGGLRRSRTTALQPGAPIHALLLHMHGISMCLTRALTRTSF